jgi:hypothetical protein
MAIVSIQNADGTPFNLAEADAWDGEGGNFPIPGNYIFEITAAVQENSSQGKPQLMLDLVVVQGETTETENGKTMKHWVSLTAKAAGRLKNLLDACGIVPAPEGFDDQELPGKQFWAEVFEDEYMQTTPMGPVPKKSTKIRKEIAVEGAVTQASPRAAAPAPKPAPAAAAAPARAAAPKLPAGPRVATSLPAPGQRLPMPTRKA